MNIDITRLLKFSIYTLVVLTGLIVILATLVLNSNATGTNPSEIDLSRFSSSVQFNNKQQTFHNPVTISLSTGRPFTTIFYDFFFNGEDRTPKIKLPEAPPPLSALSDKAEDVRFIWFGHSTIMLEIESTRVLIDPIFSNNASPVPLFAERFQPPVFEVEDIPDIDVVLISHDHYDHLDYETIMKLKDRNIRFIVPLGVAAHLKYWGIKPDKITELDWWQATEFNGLKLTCTPAQHFSGRGIFNRNSTLWASWAIHGKQHRVFFSGDSGYGDHYKKIGQLLGPFDYAFLENGAYSLDWKFVHQLPEEGVQASIDLNADVMIPVHWGMFNLALHSWHEPVERVTAEAHRRNVKLLAPRLGQLVSITENNVLEDWWSALIESI